MNTHEIEEGDFLEVFDDSGRKVLQKTIERNYDSFYNTGLKRQIYNGTTVAWLPHGIDTGYWFKLFGNGFRARLVKHEDEYDEDE